MTKKRQEELEKLLRKLRQRCFDSEKAEKLIPIVKARLMPIWERRVAERPYNHPFYACE